MTENFAGEARKILARNQDKFERWDLGDLAECKRFGLLGSHPSREYFVFSEDVGAELGHPRSFSMNLSLWNSAEFSGGFRLWLHGGGLKKETISSYLQLIIVDIAGEELEMEENHGSIKNLYNCIPGVMARNSDGKIWMKFNRHLLANGFGLYSIGQGLWYVYTSKLPQIRGMDVVLIAGNESLAAEFAGLGEKIVSLRKTARHQVLEAKKQALCNELNCSSCDEKSACDIIKKVISQRK